MPTIRAQLPSSALARLRLVFLNAPNRPISCYGQPRQTLVAWHDYYTDHGGSEGRPEIEEEINVSHLEWTRQQVHRALDEEVKRLGGDPTRVVLLGESQGGCCALDSALTYRLQIGGVFCAISQLYSATPLPAERRSLPIVGFNGAADRCIACSLALRGYAKLLDAGYDRIRLHVQPGLDHQGASKEEGALLAECLGEWGLLRAACTGGPQVGTQPSAKPPSPQTADASDAEQTTCHSTPSPRDKSSRKAASATHEPPPVPQGAQTPSPQSKAGRKPSSTNESAGSQPSPRDQSSEKPPRRSKGGGKKAATHHSPTAALSQSSTEEPTIFHNPVFV